MTFQWPSIEAIAAAWEPGCSMSVLAAKIGTSRSAISGFYGRHRDKLAGYPLRAPTRKPGRRKASAPVIKAEPKPKVERQADPVVVRVAWHESRVGKPLMMLARRQCKWPVNDAGIGEEHLFCAAPTDGRSYCAHHAKRSGWGY